MGKGRRLALAGMLFLVSVQPLTAFAGSINGNEQELLNVISGTETYNGRTYRMKEEYIAQARAYFLQDGVDITDEQKQEALASMYSSIGQGIAEGYLVPVDGGTAAGGDTGGGEASGGTPSSGSRDTSGGGSAGEEPGRPDQPEAAQTETAELETTVPETTLAPEVAALETVEMTEGGGPLDDFPLEELETASPGKILWAGCGAACACLAAGLFVAVRRGLFHHHYAKKERQK